MTRQPQVQLALERLTLLCCEGRGTVETRWLVVEMLAFFFFLPNSLLRTPPSVDFFLCGLSLLVTDLSVFSLMTECLSVLEGFVLRCDWGELRWMLAVPWMEPEPEGPMTEFVFRLRPAASCVSGMACASACQWRSFSSGSGVEVAMPVPGLRMGNSSSGIGMGPEILPRIDSPGFGRGELGTPETEPDLKSPFMSAARRRLATLDRLLGREERCEGRLGRLWWHARGGRDVGGGRRGRGAVFDGTPALPGHGA